ncbi:D-alanyl-D-alanine carboxypeptidase [Aquibacillus koreensis]|uniref:serine-type D-Ala-D-Ala carboxypeptidase n=1 Tax=Aquibacillus koreensis TaxID=279446 RepID=A0A9X4AKD7_9BACI|nr:D-alanyl-D-alanine carboxypeptidase family protein [Aquibacillus koreensis]MCT2536958.1 D-alanyl-D-alanine carboxypeptidase [Aquibacillus koreensis]MDC3422739.1 D-alanyl-D-alanine carboxypeptidase [Aquibacillus koreensis]
MRHKLRASFFGLLAFLIVVSSVTVNPLSSKAAESFDVAAESAILVDAETGKILFAKNADIKLPPASMTKMMTEYLVLEAINEGQISWDTTTLISDRAYNVSASSISSGIGLIQDKQYTVRELYEAMAIISDNATTIALAELVAGSEGEFVTMMNAKAEEMGLTEYQFVNATGLSNKDYTDIGLEAPEGTDPNADDLLSARSSALLAYHLLNDYPEVLEFSSTLLSELDGRELQNLNWMLPWEDNNFVQYGVEGVDGLKTGWTTEAGYCFTGTAERDGRRLITVVMKTESKGARFVETGKLLEYGFGQFEKQELYPAGFQIEDESSIDVAKGKEEMVEIETSAPISATIKNGDQDSYSVHYTFDESKLNEDGELTAPIEEGEKVGTMELVYNGDIDYGYINGDGLVQSVDLITTSAVEKQNWFMLTLSGIGDFFSNIFTSVVDTVKGWFS